MSTRPMKSAAQQLNAAQLAIANSLGDPEIKAAVAQFGFTAAILTIGSLFWGTNRHRQAWRQDRLNVESAIRVRAPIRYGRWSLKNETYSMVFSNGLLPEQCGWALAVPCRGVIHTFDDLVDEAKALWAAERNSSSPGPLAASWGAVGILANPRRAALDLLMADWSTMVADADEIYKKFPHDDDEAAAVTPDGRLAIPWPTTENGDPLNADFVLATANEPTTPYATAETIADACRTNPKAREYFDKTWRVGIRTAFDDEIRQCLE